LIASSNESASESSTTSDMEGGGPSKNKSPKKKSSRHGSKASSKSNDDSSDDETTNKSGKRINKKTAERIRKQNEEEAKKKQQVEEVRKEEAKKKEEEKKAAEKKKAEIELKKAEESKRKEDERKKIIAMNDPKETAWMNFNDVLSEASGFFIRNTPHSSKEKFGEALDIIAKSFSSLKFKKGVKNCDEVVVIKFMYARACTMTNNYSDIISGHAKLTEIVTVHKEVRFPAAYLALALMFKKLNRYDHALQFTEKGVDFFNKNLPCVTYNYPGIPSQPLEETRPDYLKNLFNSLKVEFKCPPKPDAICKFKNCLTVHKNIHIIPSENICLSDPDFRGYFKVWCRSNCALDFHDTCWGALKTDYIDILAKATKTPTEKDFFGLKCFTPDCEGLIIKIQIYDSNGENKTLEDKKLMDKLEMEEKIKKDEEKKKKEKDVKENQLRKMEEKIKKSKKRKDRNKSSSEKDSDSVQSDIKVDIGPKVVVPSNLPTVENYSKNSTPPPDIPLDQVTILKKHKEPEVEEDSNDKRKAKKNKERNTLHLEEFNNSDGLATGMPDPGDYQNRIERLAAIKKTFEEQSRATSETPKPPPMFYNIPPPKHTLEDKIDNYLNPNASVYVPNNQPETLSLEIIEDSVKSFVFQTLKKDGPMKENDPKFTKEFGSEAKKLIMEKRGLINFLKSDERFASYNDYICLRGEAEKAKKINDQEVKARESMERKPVSTLGEMAKKIREQLEREQDPDTPKPNGAFGLNDIANKASILEMIKKDAANGSKSPIIESSTKKSIRDLGVQTDVSSLDLDELDDPLILKQQNAALIAELQESKDKLYKTQNERKMESKEMIDKVKAANDDKNRHKVENTNFKETIQKMKKTYNEAARKEEELKQVKDTLESEQQKSGLMQVDLNNTKLRLENEQRLSFQLNSQLQSSRDQEVMIKALKLKCLKTEYDGAKLFLMGKKVENEKLMSNLANMNNNDTNQASYSTIKSSIDKLNGYSARLYQAIDDLQDKYTEKVRHVEQNPGSGNNTDLNFDSSSFESPQLTSVEVDTLRLLASVSLNARPQVAPFANYPNTTRPPPSRPPGLLGPPPGLSGLPPRSEADSLTSIRAAIARPRAASSPRPDPAVTTARPTSGLAVTRPPTAGHIRPALAGAPRPAAEGKPKSYQKLLAQLQGRYRELNTPDAERYIHLLRGENNGKLSGMSIQSINERVGRFIQADRDKRRAENDTDNNCSICLEDMVERDSRRLNPCQHKFHNMCIDNWLATPGGAGNTCPMCRHYIVQDEEYPDLGHSGHRRH